MVELNDVVTRSAEETEAIGYALGNRLVANQILCLFGELGAGKTTFIRGVAKGVTKGSCATLSSPTFAYLHIYEGVLSLYHFDLYRMKGPEEFLGMGFDDYFFAGGVCCLEWSERIANLVPPEALRITLYHGVREAERRIEVQNGGFFANAI